MGSLRKLQKCILLQENAALSNSIAGKVVGKSLRRISNQVIIHLQESIWIVD